MSELSNNQSASESMEDKVDHYLEKAKEGLRERHQKCRSRIRETPTRAMVGAVAFGYVLHRLPMRAILVTQIRVLAALAPPAVLLFKGAQLYDYLKEKKSSDPS